MALPLFERIVAYVTRPKAAQVNVLYDEVEKISLATMLSTYANTETLSANKTLTEADAPIQVLTPSGANRDVVLPAISATAHPYTFHNPSASSYNLNIMLGSAVLILVAPGQSSQVIPAGATAWITSAILNRLNRGFIDGLKMTWVSATAIDIEIGAAFVPGLGKIVNVDTKISKTGLSLSASTFYHVYLYENSGAAAVEVVTTAPATAYWGTARSKTGDTTRRYIGSILTDGSSNVIKFIMSGTSIKYNTTIVATSPFRVLSAGTATSTTAVSTAGVAPTTATLVSIFVINNASTPALDLKNAAGNVLASALAGQRYAVDTFVESQNLYYSNNAGSGNANIDVLGYTFER